jgi:membrane-associated protein
MEMIADFIGLFTHLDQHLNLIIRNFGAWTYVIVFLIVFCETGLVITPLLPGDSLLFALGTFAAIGALELELLLGLLSLAAVAGDAVNYSVGRILGPRIFRGENVRFLKKEYLDRTHKFYETYGGKTIFLARFVPIIRTFAPFVAGIGSMTYWRFASYNILGGVSWIAVFVLGGYYFGNLAFVKQNFTLIIVAIIFISILPAVIELVRQRMQTS